MTSTATLTFSTRNLAQKFCTDWGRKTLTGHDMSAGGENVQVKVYNVTNDLQAWIAQWIENNSATNLSAHNQQQGEA